MILMHDADLKVTPWSKIYGGVALVKLLTSESEIIFHHVEKAIVMAGIYSRVIDDDKSIFVEILGEFLTILLPVACLIEIIGDIEGGDFDL